LNNERRNREQEEQAPLPLPHSHAHTLHTLPHPPSSSSSTPSHSRVLIDMMMLRAPHATNSITTRSCHEERRDTHTSLHALNHSHVVSTDIPFSTLSFNTSCLSAFQHSAQPVMNKVQSPQWGQTNQTTLSGSCHGMRARLMHSSACAAGIDNCFPFYPPLPHSHPTPAIHAQGFSATWLEGVMWHGQAGTLPPTPCPARSKRRSRERERQHVRATHNDFMQPGQETSLCRRGEGGERRSGWIAKATINRATSRHQPHTSCMHGCSERE
jgi:hypothetical protein